ncbi:MAG: maltose alpha-D-glucosyltransferase [Thermodesulfovibrionales bacterium]
MPPKETYLEDDPLWYRDAVIYEVHVRSFYDSDGDGIGDFRGLTEKLDYIEDLGVTAIWLLPFYPSPLKDEGYDTSDYVDIHPSYGTLKDFREFLREAHRRGIRVIIELVLNHTSDQHPWFQRARLARPGTSARNFYVWSDTPERYADARIIFKDYEPSNWAWDPVARAYYWHRFYSHQPDLNFENHVVQKALMRTIDFWLGMGVDGLRLDAVPYLYEREGTNCENLSETHEFLRKLRAHVDGRFSNRMLLAEANQWPEDASAYFGAGDECHMAFHFPLMPRMFMAVQMEDRFPIIDILEQTPPIPETCQWTMFLRNHDELTLEMVTDEERDYMYRVYAKDPRARINLGIRRRLAPLNDNDRRKMELMNVMLVSFPGTPVIYYGDELGMGDNYYLGDRNGVRTPMQWSSDRNAGFSKANPQRLYLPVIIDPEYHYEALNVENQQRNPSSLLWWMRSLIAMRKRFKAFGRGSLEFLMPENTRVLAFIRRYEDEHILVVINLSRSSQVAELDLSAYSGWTPEDVFSFNEFPQVREDAPYMLSLGPHGYHVFQLKEARAEEGAGEEAPLPEFAVAGSWRNVFEGRDRLRFERQVIPAYLDKCRWFGGKGRPVARARVAEVVPVAEAGYTAYLMMLEVEYSEGPSETYLLPATFIPTGGAGQPAEEFVAEGMSLRLDYEWLEVKASRMLEEYPRSGVARIVSDEGEGVLCDASYDSRFQEAVLAMFARRKRTKWKGGELMALQGRRFREVMKHETLPMASKALKAEQSNTSVLYGNAFFLKIYRRVYEGVNPDAELTRFITTRTDFRNIPPYAGAIEYRKHGSEPRVIALLQGYVASEGDAWRHMLGAVDRYFERVMVHKAQAGAIPELPQSLVGQDFSSIPPLMEELMGGHFTEMAGLLGRRTGELHLALASSRGDPNFDPEPFSLLYQRSAYQSMRSLARRVLMSVRKGQRRLPEALQEEVSRVLALEPKIISRLKRILQRKFSASKMRVHGDYHLGQVLYTGKDFIIIDFEGEPARPLSERRLKRSPLVDVAGMIRSFHYAAYTALFQHAAMGKAGLAELEPWVEPWHYYMSGVFFDSYARTVGGAGIIPGDSEELEALLDCFLLEKAVYELGYELNNRPDWLVIPIKGIQRIMKS